MKTEKETKQIRAAYAKAYYYKHKKRLRFQRNAWYKIKMNEFKELKKAKKNPLKKPNILEIPITPQLRRELQQRATDQKRSPEALARAILYEYLA